MGRNNTRRIMFAVESPGGMGPAECRKVAALALALDAELELFHCIFDEGVAGPGRFGTRGAQEDIHSFVRLRRDQLECAAESFRARGVRVRTSVRWDYPPYEGIVRQVLRHKPSLLIGQSIPKGRVTRALFNTTDYKLIETCPCPVLFIKTSRPYTDAMLLAAVDPQRSHEKPEALDHEILKSAAMLRDALSASMHVLYMQTPWDDVTRAHAELRNVPEVARDDVYAAYCNSMETRVRELARRYAVADEQVHVVEGYPADLLPRFANREGAHIVVLGCMARSWPRRMLLGHTAEKVLDVLYSDVLVVKAPDFRCPVSRQSTHHVEASAPPRGRLIW